MQVQIDYEIFRHLCYYFLLESDEADVERIKAALEDKLNKLVDREYFTRYKRAATPEERETARRAYLDRREISKPFRTPCEVKKENL